MKIFISHPHIDSDLALTLTGSLRAVLRDDSTHIYCSSNNISKVSAQWRRELEKELLEADIVLVLWTPHAQEKCEWVMYESGGARLLMKERIRAKETLERPFLISCLVGTDNPPSPLKENEYFNLTKVKEVKSLLQFLIRRDGIHRDQALDNQVDVQANAIVKDAQRVSGDLQEASTRMDASLATKTKSPALLGSGTKSTEESQVKISLDALMECLNAGEQRAILKALRRRRSIDRTTYLRYLGKYH